MFAVPKYNVLRTVGSGSTYKIVNLRSYVMSSFHDSIVIRSVNSKTDVYLQKRNTTKMTRVQCTKTEHLQCLVVNTDYVTTKARYTLPVFTGRKYGP